MDLADSQKFEAIRDVYRATLEELRFWRERNFKATAWAITLMIAIGGADLFSDRRSYVVAVAILALCMMMTVYLHKNFGRYRDAVKLRASVQDALCLFDKGVYREDEPVLESSFKHPEPAYWRGTGVFIGALWVVGLSVAAALILP